MGFDVAAVRSRFPALARLVDGVPAVYVDGPGGTQVVETVIEAMSAFMRRGGSNLGGPFVTSTETEAAVEEARTAAADLFGAASSSEIAFGQNMTSITLSVSRALAATWRPGDEIVVTRLDHDANVSPWLIAAEHAGATVRFVDFDASDGSLTPAMFDSVLDDRTRLVAVTHASNAIGTIVDVAGVVERAHEVGALVYVDAVHHAPHGLIDVAASDCDFLVASAYKFFGPHTGILYGKLALLASVPAVRIRPAPSDPPGKWETGTQSFESLAGVTAAIDYLASHGPPGRRRPALVGAMAAIRGHETALGDRFVDGVAGLRRVRLYGAPTMEGRAPTFAIGVEGRSAQDVARALGRQGIFVWHGHYYALEVMRHLGVLDSGGLVRVGLAHYNTPSEVDRVVAALGAL
ncbi:MAG TPA: cysteine desulfurase-like protein [Acidimicrobiia bacterium]|jgi:cysteine desulfurase family protein (TIGR01976 family)